MSSSFTGPIKNAIKKAGAREWLSGLPFSGGPDLVEYFNDFIASQDYAATDWVLTVTEAGNGDASLALSSERNGALVITNDDANDDAVSAQMSSDGGTSVMEAWKLEVGEKMWFEARVKMSDVLTEDAFIGLCITDTTPLVATDRIGLQLDTTDATWQCISEKDSVETKTDSGVDAVNATYNRIGMYWDGVNTVKFFVDRALVATHTTNIPDDEELAITIHHQNGDAVADTMTIDYIYCAAERA
jgi:hypothetical protein